MPRAGGALVTGPARAAHGRRNLSIEAVLMSPAVGFAAIRPPVVALAVIWRGRCDLLPCTLQSYDFDSKAPIG
jgi:hypothetical protein